MESIAVRVTQLKRGILAVLSACLPKIRFVLSTCQALAVIKWKKLLGFYRDLENEYFSAYTLDGNSIVNEDQA